jgi:uncharacterized protein YceK
MIDRRSLLAVALLAVLVGLAGCSSILGPGEPDPGKINQNVSYDWDTDANVTIDVTADQYAAVYEIDNRQHIELYQRDALGTENPLDARALKFRFQNGTVRNVSVDAVEQTRRAVNVTLPDDDGRFAFTGVRVGKAFSIPTYVDGTHEIRLPQDARVGVPLLAQVRPRNATTTLGDDGRVTLTWADVEAETISIRYYLERDLYLFGGLLAVAVLLGVGGTLYYLRQIRALERRRDEVGLDVDTGDDSDDKGPPPGMR